MRAVVLFVVVSLASATAQADCPAMAGSTALTVHDDETRLVWIQQRLARTAHRATIWRDGWGAGIIVATAVDLAFIPILGDTTSHRIDFGLGAATTLPGIVPLIFWKPRVMDDHVTLDERIANPSLDRCAVLADAEHFLVVDAAAERKQRAWYMHAGNIVLNAGITLLFGAFDHWTSGILNGVGGALVGEAIIFTEPIDQIDDLEHYKRGDFTLPPLHAWQLVPVTVPQGAGLALSLSFD